MNVRCCETLSGQDLLDIGKVSILFEIELSESRSDRLPCFRGVFRCPAGRRAGRPWVVRGCHGKVLVITLLRTSAMLGCGMRRKNSLLRERKAEAIGQVYAESRQLCNQSGKMG